MSRVCEPWSARAKPQAWRSIVGMGEQGQGSGGAVGPIPGTLTPCKSRTSRAQENQNAWKPNEPEPQSVPAEVIAGLQRSVARKPITAFH